ncbi:holo-ACP synthase [Mucilaginibacter hurinus]|uniref:Holo-ACP synthase n=1 Tax=Mucilaginibacter hurinus TaxID=2201324 RepID=A0A367GJK3_9SPHI|nr:holo-ACP synthase [Mucilaginibacter hurinus]RCH53649.1 holo-ACP synthase [Mucilaginibacter hurinus]
MESRLQKTLEETIIGQQYAVGNDLVFIPGFIHSLTELFKQKVFTDAEIAYCDRFDNAVLHYASTWAAKEAVYKAVKQLNPTPLGWKKIEISREKLGGRPCVLIHKHPCTFNVSLTISHDGDYAWAVAIIDNKF